MNIFGLNCRPMRLALRRLSQLLQGTKWLPGKLYLSAGLQPHLSKSPLIPLSLRLYSVQRQLRYHPHSVRECQEEREGLFGLLIYLLIWC